ncbi:MAG: hypothetical protein ACOX69_00705 [Coriobacteriales bacterium]|jgi:hypothetical protein
MSKFKKHHFGRKAVSVATAGAFVFMMAAPFGVVQPAEAESMSADGYVTAAASRAAQTAPEILGLTGVEETSSSTGAAGWGNQDWSAPKYYIFGDTTYNTAANPYMVNAVSVQQGTDSDASPTIVLNTARNSGGKGPMAALATYGTDDTDDDVWGAKPDVVIGVSTGSGTADYDSADYIGSDLYNSGYHPKGVAYYSGENSNIIKEMYAIAEAADQVVADSNGTKKLRYGSATEIATNYEKYVRGTQGLIMRAINTNKVEKKTIALVNAYNSDAGTYTLTKPGDTLSGAAAGTSTVDHYLDMVNVVTNNLATKLNKTTVTADELSQADIILVGGNSVDSSEVASHIPSTLLSKTYYTTDYNAGAIYDVMHNAVDNVQNAGRLLGFVYPEVVDQDDWICYYYSKFYHVKTDKLAEVIDKAMDGVRNYDATDAANYLQWDESDASTYNESSVQSKLDEGVAYYATQTTSDADALTSNITSGSDLAEGVNEMLAELAAMTNPTQADIDAVKAAYKKLTDAQKALVTNYDSIIVAAQAKVDAANSSTTTTTTGAKKGTTKKISAGTVKVTSNGTGSKATVAFTKAKNKKSITVPATVKINGKTYQVTSISKNAFKSAKKVRTVTVGKNVKKIAAKAFNGSKVNKVILKTKKLTKKSVKGSLKGSKVKTVKVNVGKTKADKKYKKKYTKCFKKANSGKKVTVKR